MLRGRGCVLILLLTSYKKVDYHLKFNKRSDVKEKAKAEGNISNVLSEWEIG